MRLSIREHAPEDTREQRQTVAAADPPRLQEHLRDIRKLGRDLAPPAPSATPPAAATSTPEA